jgi:hypothetical protein
MKVGRFGSSASGLGGNGEKESSLQAQGEILTNTKTTQTRVLALRTLRRSNVGGDIDSRAAISLQLFSLHEMYIL